MAESKWTDGIENFWQAASIAVLLMALAWSCTQCVRCAGEMDRTNIENRKLREAKP